MRCTRGAAAAELALLLPLLAVMLFGAIEVAYYFYNEHQVVKGVRDGARYASRQSFDDVVCTGSSGAGSIDSGVVNAVKAVTRTGRPNGTVSRVPGWGTVATDVTVSVSCNGTTTGIYAGDPGAPVVTVSAELNYISLFDGVGILTDSYKLRASQQAAVMGI